MNQQFAPLARRTFRRLSMGYAHAATAELSIIEALTDDDRDFKVECAKAAAFMVERAELWKRRADV